MFSGRGADWLIRHLPTPILLNVERVAVKSFVILAGGATLIFVPKNSLAALLPQWALYVWAATWLLGGIFGLVGFWRNSHMVEMAGHRLIILGAVVFGIAVGVVAGFTGIVSILFAAVLAACSAVRLLMAGASKRTQRRNP